MVCQLLFALWLEIRRAEKRAEPCCCCTPALPHGGCHRSGTSCCQSPGDSADGSWGLLPPSGSPQVWETFESLPEPFPDRSALCSLAWCWGWSFRKRSPFLVSPLLGHCKATVLSCWGCCAFAAVCRVLLDGGPQTGDGPRALRPALPPYPRRVARCLPRLGPLRQRAPSACTDTPPARVSCGCCTGTQEAAHPCCVAAPEVRSMGSGWGRAARSGCSFLLPPSKGACPITRPHLLLWSDLLVVPCADPGPA